jgi:hypothetical protein
VGGAAPESINKRSKRRLFGGTSYEKRLRACQDIHDVANGIPHEIHKLERKSFVLCPVIIVQLQVSLQQIYCWTNYAFHDGMRMVTVEMDGLVRILGNDNINLGNGVRPVLDGKRLIEHGWGKNKGRRVPITCIYREKGTTWFSNRGLFPTPRGPNTPTLSTNLLTLSLVALQENAEKGKYSVWKTSWAALLPRI